MLRYAITDRTLFASSNPEPGAATPRPSSAPAHQALVAHCAALAHQGMDALIIREKDLSAGPLTSLCRRIASAVRAANPRTRILVAGRADIALAAALDGVHLSARPGELTPAQIRTLFAHAGHPAPHITLSCHTLPEVLAARITRPDAILFAPIFGKTLAGDEVTPPAGLAALSEACRAAAPIPVLALGGITPQNTPSCLQAGAAGIAAIRLFMQP